MPSRADRHVVLVAPEIHWNTGNIGRTCLGTGAVLHLIKPLGFSLDDASLKRAGLDYWHRVRLNVWDSFEDFQRVFSPRETELALFTKSGKQPFWKMQSGERMFLVFGSETRGLPPELLARWEGRTFFIPIHRQVRSLNLSTAVGIGLYESLRSTAPFHEWKIG